MMLANDMEQFGSAVILAGGKSTRMGFDKQLLKVQDRYLVRHQARLLAQRFDQIVVVTHSPELYGDTSFTLVGDRYAGQGPLAGLHAGMTCARSRYVYLLACDMPFVNPAYILHMQERMRGLEADACVARFGAHIEPFNAFYNRRLLDDLEAFLEAGGGSFGRFLRGRDTLYIAEHEARRFSPDWNMFTNLNTRQEFEHWRRRIPDFGMSAEPAARAAAEPGQGET